MRNPRSWRKLWILLVIPSVLALKCGSCDPIGVGEDFNVTVTLQNLDTPLIGQAVHLFGPGEDFPAGRLEPGTSRTIELTLRVDESAAFGAGRNGSILTTKSCTCTDSGCRSDEQVKVEWNGSSLSCVGW